MHVVYMCISVLMNYDCTTHPILPFITITTTFLSKHCILKRVEKRSCEVQILSNQKMSNFHFDWTIIETFPRGGAWRFRAGAKILRGGAKRSQGRCAPSHTSPQNPVMFEIHFRSARDRVMTPFTKKNRERARVSDNLIISRFFISKIVL
jgi:hypothetical protein